MTKLEENRVVINEVDRELTKLFEKRFAAVEGIVQYKMENGLPVLDRSREEELIRSREAELPEHLRPYFRSWYEALMASSRQYQTDIIEQNKK